MADDELAQPDAFAATLDGLDEVGPFGPRYRVLATLGRGAMGTVFKVLDTELDEVVALKVLRPELAADRQAALRLRREVKLARRVTHENVARVFDLQVHDDALLITMEFVDGRSLQERRESRSPREVAALARQICAGLQAAHDAGVVHRDLKPDNVMLASDGVVKLADFGIATTTREDPGGEFVGTPYYVAPEQARGEAVDGRADIYALGAMMWEMLAGEPPWQADTVMKVIMRRLVEPPPALPADCAPERLRRIVAMCLAREPDSRFATAGALAEALDAMEEIGATAELEHLHSAGNLPTRANTFVGREHELEELRTRIAGDERLVTLLGPGGTGKTRLALEVGRALLSELGNAWFIDLSEATTREDLVGGVCRVLDVPPGDERLKRALRTRGQTLVILDNLEQVVADAADTVGDWLAEVPDLRVLATSRIRLGIAAEHVFALAPLETQRAVELFEQRARMVRPDYEVGAAEVTVRQIVERVDCLPLAVEIVAAQMRLLGEAQILARLEDRFRALRDQRRDRPERHSTMLSVLDGSWQLLSSAAQQALAQLSVFRGGATLETACEVLDVADSEAWPEELLEELWDHSLVRFADDRIELLAMVREYAGSRLDDAEPVFVRHGRVMAALVSRLARGSAMDQARLAVERANLHVACSRAVARHDTATVAAALDGLTIIYRMHGNPDLALYERALELGDASWRHRVVLWYAGALIHFGRDDEARVLLEPAADAATEPDAQTRALANKILAEIAQRAGDPAEVREHEGELLRIAQEVGEPRLLADAWSTKAFNHWTRAEFDDAQLAYERALTFAPTSSRSGGCKVCSASCTRTVVTPSWRRTTSAARSMCIEEVRI